MKTRFIPAGLAGERLIHVHVQHQCPIISAGLFAVLSTQPDFKLSVEAHGVSPSTERCVVVADYKSGVRMARERRRDAAGEPIPLAVMTLTCQVKASAIRHAMESGVRGYIIQGCDINEVIDGVRMLSRGNYYLSPIADRLEAEWLRRPQLTQREAEVLRVLASGTSDKVIARGLGIQVGTVKTHMKQLFQKLGVSTRTQAVIKAMDLGLYDPPRDPQDGCG